MKTKAEIQFAHDRLEPFVRGELSDAWQRLDPTEQLAIHAALDVLCWILECPVKGETFAYNLRKIAAYVASHGFVLDPSEAPPLRRPAGRG